jgi:hypothetical protein
MVIIYSLSITIFEIGIQNLRFVSSVKPKSLFLMVSGLLCLAMTSTPVIAEDWDDSHLAVPRNQTHPIDQVIFLTEWGVGAARLQLERWEADPEMQDRLNRREAYREYVRQREVRLVEAELRAKPGESDVVEAPSRQLTKPVEAPDGVVSARPATELDGAGLIEDAGSRSATEAADTPEKIASARPATDPRSESTKGSVPAVDAQEEESRVTEQVADLQRRMDRLEDAYSTLYDSHHASLWDIDLLKAAKEELEERVQELARKYSSLLEEHEELRARYESLADAHAALEVAYAEVVEQLEAQTDAPAKVHIQPSTHASIQPPPTPSAEAKRLNEKGLQALDEDRAPVAVRWFLQAHQAGSVNAANNLGFLYEHGWGTVQSLSEAYLWYQRAAESGHPHGMRNLARFYREGRGVNENAERAQFWDDQSEAAERHHVGR